ncbi:MmgE/PrpD family protein [Bacillus sp. ISL-47]|uniref:MmgE/PrpD family protein n=1 Tax=Bacillus sp. ISL-47 TaxID=2819130 RepID=UPI001BE68605|nr:MmgE/PrpD family protein [Bacillus sp. ISL-47]MBT2689825.1 MmgE/PrpD family protein [Bacillus sp. ISL-47]MBT2709273.1 MmgE/PrpD family protein [Pseudomonas sp. ISL-84]
MILTKTLAEYANKISFEDLPDEVVEFTKLCILDWYGSALAGKDEKPVQSIKELLNEWGGNEQASLVTGGKSSIGNACLVNAAASHIVELDDIHKSSIIHAGTVVIPAAVAVAEAYQLSGRELITAVAVGYEICYRIGEAVSPSHYYYWHNTATCGTFGSAAAVAKLLKLSVEQTMYALGNAGTQAAGLWEFIEDGANTKQLHTAKAAYNGALAALLARKNFTSASKILEGRRGFFNAMSEKYDPEKITMNLGSEFKIMENSFKIHASCRHTHPAMDCILDIMKENSLQHDQIQNISIGTYQTVLNITDNPTPKTVYASKFSSQFCAALIAVKGSASLIDYNEEILHSPVINELMKKVDVQEDPYFENAYPQKWGAKVIITLKDGRTFIESTDYPKGDPEKAASRKELIEKFKTMTRDKIQDAEEQVDAILRLEEIQVSEWIAMEVREESCKQPQ